MKVTVHSTSIAVWDVPSPVVVNHPFTVRVGVKCSLACPLTGQQIVVRDDLGNRVGVGNLGDTPVRRTSALYEVEVKLVAPVAEGVYSWSATFGGVGSESAHADASALLSFRTVGPPEHWITVTVRTKETEIPLENVEVQLGVYRASTDERGQARLKVPKGTYNVHLWKVGYETDVKTVEVTESVTIPVTAVWAPDQDLDDEQVWM